MEISKYNPCSEAVAYRSVYTSFEDAWNNCHRGDWMLWIAQRVGVDIKVLTKAKALCALTVRHLMKDERSIKACEVALKFADGEATSEELSNAANAAVAAYAAAADAADDAAANAAIYAAIYAAYAADATYADAANAAAYADAANANAATYADDANAREKSRKQTADICREVLTDEVFKLIKQ